MDPSATFANCQVHQSTSDTFQHECHTNTSQNSRGWRKIVINFTPSWFSVNMGTGIASILLHNLPYNGRWLYWISVAIFCLNVLLFLTFLAISVLRYVMFKGLFTFMIRHPVQSLFVGTFPMGLATIINMIVFVCVPAWGPWAVTLAWTLWWIDAAISITTCFSLPFVIMSNHKSDLSTITAAWLLPIVSTIVASASGGIVAEVLPNPQHALWTVIISYILWGTGFPLAMVILVMYFHRLTIHHLPPREVIVSVFLPLGPIGQGSFALMQLGKVALKIFPITGTFEPDSGRFFYNLGNYAALIIWGYGLVWLFFALASISRSRFPFNMGWWGFTFPLGVYTVATTTLAKDLPSDFFKVLGTIFSVTVVLLWLTVFLKTLQRAATGKLFFAPCVKDYEAQLAQKTAGSVLFIHFSAFSASLFTTNRLI
ncbi:C4-dicarboxylate transporter/malic acid transport protein-like protein [Mytilinidion resinicola]|uniref:Sulfite efflux pump SSU1 n=1 Tax=Mytilinidion resinicola TaxID=574789 RepID=A0A6A6Y018_9PEZI|nr:C4-dicarboxylate transporter/malic acid transport protein-like protein [Mytilinidion resinicola]KAF2801863.1 C4-dicarboxylate transporter/malic acid transport protein-like protein [Mytilinidion resinicola]